MIQITNTQCKVCGAPKEYRGDCKACQQHIHKLRMLACGRWHYCINCNVAIIKESSQEICNGCMRPYNDKLFRMRKQKMRKVESKTVLEEFEHIDHHIQRIRSNEGKKRTIGFRCIKCERHWGVPPNARCKKP